LPLPPLASWQLSPPLPAVAFDIPYWQYAPLQQFYGAAFGRGVAAALAPRTARVLVANFQPSSAGTTRVIYRLLLPPANGPGALLALGDALLALFQQPIGVGAMAGTPLVAALATAGLPISCAFYEDQIPAQPPAPPQPAPPRRVGAGGEIYAPPPTPTPPPPPLSLSPAHAPLADNGEALALLMPAESQCSSVIGAALCAALEELLALAPGAAAVTDMAAALGRDGAGCVMYLDIALVGTADSSSGVVSGAAAALASLFESNARGARANAALVGALVGQGVVAQCFYQALP
jgi:hypothetical protein